MVVQVNTTIQLDAVKAKMSQQNIDRGKYSMANQVLADMNIYVPRLEGPLEGSGRVSADHEWVIWDTPYARRRFYEYATNYTMPGTGRRWDLLAKGNHVRDWEQAFIKGAGF